MQPLTGWTGQTRRLMWTGQKYRPVRVKMTSLATEHVSFSLSVGLVGPFPFPCGALTIPQPAALGFVKFARWSRAVNLPNGRRVVDAMKVRSGQVNRRSQVGGGACTAPFSFVENESKRAHGDNHHCH